MDADYPDEKFAVTDFSHRCQYLSYILENKVEILQEWSGTPVEDVFLEFLVLSKEGLRYANEIATGSQGRTNEAKQVIDEAWVRLMDLTFIGDGAFDVNSDIVVSGILEDIERNL